MQPEPDPSASGTEPVHENSSTVQPNFSRALKPLAELVADPGFPHSALGEFTDIGGYTGVVVQVVKQSIKVRSPDGITRSFNANRLRTIYGPAPKPPPAPEPPPVSSPSRQEPSAPEAPKKPPAIEPDFTKPVRPIADLASRPDFPECVLGEHIEIGDYKGVVVQIVNRSLKVRSQAEITRSYNADALRKLHSKSPGTS
ncbi:MAG: hypothetical protein AB9869_20785 [Verrucomicrobiia bacterium]